MKPSGRRAFFCAALFLFAATSAHALRRPEQSCVNTLLTYQQLREIAQVGTDFDRLPVAEKVAIINEKIAATEYDLSRLPDFYQWRDFLGYLRVIRDLGKAFSFRTDFMDIHRPKIIHAIGSTAWVRFEVEPTSPFTGFYKSGGTALLRMSPAIPSNSLKNFMPGSAFKFLVDGRPSVNFPTMPSLDGQETNQNPFSFPTMNKLPAPTKKAAKALALYFGLFKRDPKFIPLTELATMNQQGLVIDSPVSPEVLYLQPTPEVRSLIPPDSPNDVRVNLAKIPVGTVLWEVYAQRTGQTSRILIGRMVLDSRFISSYAGDRIYMRHQR